MTTRKKICVIAVAVVVAAAVACGGYFGYRKIFKPGSSSSEKVFVQKVSEINVASTGNVAATRFAGVIEAQKSVDVKYDTTKIVSDVLVKEGDSVKRGDKLLTYDVNSINLDLEKGKLEVEQMENDIATNKNEITKLQSEMQMADADAVVSYKTQILSLESDNAKAEYDIKAKKNENKKLEDSVSKAYVTASIDGTVKNLKSVAELQDSSTPDVIMQLSADGDYKVAGTVNEQNIQQISQGTPVIIKSRVDDTQWSGEIATIDTNPQSNSNDIYYGDSDESTQSSKYTFYVTPESLDGFMLGQHVIIEIDDGMGDSMPKSGIWLDNSFICKDGKTNYVWLKNSDGEIEKHTVTLGADNKDLNCVEITKGLKKGDYIAYPMSYIEEGMKTTTNMSDISVAPNELDNTGEDGLMGGDDGYVYDDGAIADDTMTDEEMMEGMLTDEQMSSMTDEEIEAYYNELWGAVADDGALTDETSQE